MHSMARALLWLLVLVLVWLQAVNAGLFRKLFRRIKGSVEACNTEKYESMECTSVVDRNRNGNIELPETIAILDKINVTYNSHMHEYLYQKLDQSYKNTLVDKMLHIYRDEQNFIWYTMIYYYQRFIYPCTFAIIIITVHLNLYYYIFYAKQFRQIWFTLSLLLWLLILSICHYCLNFVF